MCKLNDILILNGRNVGDLAGSFTSDQWNGSATVDYFLSPNDFTKHISKFNVGKFIPWLSDHCPINATIILNGLETRNKSHNGKLKKLHPGFIWNEEAKSRYNIGLNSIAIKDRIQTLMVCNDSKPMNIAREIKDILISNAGRCKLKKKKSLRKNISAPWFDSECEHIKSDICKLGNFLKQNPNDQASRKELYKQKKNCEN